MCLVPLPDFTFLPFSLLRWIEPMPDFIVWHFSLLRWMELVSFLCLISLFYLFHYCAEWNWSRSSAWFHCFTFFTIALNGIGPRSSAWFHLFMFTFLIIALSGIGLVPLPDFTFLFYLFHYCVEWNGSHSSAWFHFFTFFTTLLCWIYKCGQIHKTYLKCTNMIRKLKIILLPSLNSHLTQSKVSYGLCVDYLELGDC